MERLIFGLLVSLFFNCASASQQTGQITTIVKRASDGLTYLWMNGSRTSKPGCAAGSYWIVANENSDAGKQQIAMLTAAKLSGQTITILGGNGCSRWGDGEDINEVHIH